MSKSTGLGDTVHKTTKFLKIDTLAEKIVKAAGKKDCGCKKRQEKLNKIFPYK